MKISNSTQNYINQSYANQAATKAAEQAANQEKPAEETVATDSINLSSTTRDLQKISAAAETEPENREQLVADLKQQVQSNQYTVNAEQVAEKMIGSIMDELG
jgi:negative regulator of flagellin synthesis FlgM